MSGGRADPGGRRPNKPQPSGVRRSETYLIPETVFGGPCTHIQGAHAGIIRSYNVLFLFLHL